MPLDKTFVLAPDSPLVRRSAKFSFVGTYLKTTLPFYLLSLMWCSASQNACSSRCSHCDYNPECRKGGSRSCLTVCSGCWLWCDCPACVQSHSSLKSARFASFVQLSPSGPSAPLQVRDQAALNLRCMCPTGLTWHRWISSEALFNHERKN